MRPPFQARPQRHQHQQQQQNNGYSGYHQPNGYQNQMEPNQLGMMNTQMMNNPMMGHMNNQIPMPNMPIHPQFFNNLSHMPQQQQLHQFGLPNHINQFLPNLLGNLQFMAHSLPLVQPNFFQPPIDSSGFTSQPQLNSFNSLPYPPPPNSHQNHESHPPGFPEPIAQLPQGQSVEMANNTNGSGFKGNDFGNNFTKQLNFKGSSQGFQRSHQADNAKKKFGFNKDHMGKGKYNKMGSGFDGSDAGNITKENKRSFALTYTPKEIQQWREARRKNFPTKLNVEKNMKKIVSDSNLDEEAKNRRQQLQEVLAKQAELGVEVAEVPSHYLSNTNEQVNGDREDNNGQFQYNGGKKGRFQKNRHNKRRHGDKDKFNKKPRFQNQNSSREYMRKPTLLEKLLSADIKRDKSQLLQVFRFMVMNSFFKEETEKPLKLPVVIVEETGCEHSREDHITEVLCDDPDDVDVNDDDGSCDEDMD